MNPFSFIRFKKTIPNPPDATPGDHLDAFYSASEGKIVARDSDGNAVRFDGGGASGTGTTTDDDAAAGQIGEYKQSIGAPATALSSNTPVNATSLSLGAGDWEVQGLVTFFSNAATVSSLIAGLNVTSATVPTYSTARSLSGSSHTGVDGIPTLRERFSLASTTIIHLVANATFGAGAVQVSNFKLSARRVR